MIRGPGDPVTARRGGGPSNDELGLGRRHLRVSAAAAARLGVTSFPSRVTGTEVSDSVALALSLRRLALRLAAHD